MPTPLPLCPQCQSNLYVRVERILSGRRVSSAYYCGRCHHEWHVESVPPRQRADRRTSERRKQLRALAKNQGR